MWLLKLGIRKSIHLFPRIAISSLTLGFPFIIYLCMLQATFLFSGTQTANSLVVFIQPNTPETSINQLTKKLSKHPEIRKIKYTTPDEALQSLSKYIGIPSLLESFDKENPLPASLIITPKHTQTNTELLESEISAYPEVLSIERDSSDINFASTTLTKLPLIGLSLLLLSFILVVICLKRITGRLYSRISMPALLCKIHGMSCRRLHTFHLSLGTYLGVIFIHTAISAYTCIYFLTRYIFDFDLIAWASSSLPSTSTILLCYISITTFICTISSWFVYKNRSDPTFLLKNRVIF